MKYMILCLVFILASLSFCLSSYASGVDINKNWGIGLQGNYPLLGGISVRYYGLSPVYFQAVGRFISNGEEKDNMLGAGVSYAILEHVKSVITRLYFSLEAGGRYKKSLDWSNWIPAENRNEYILNIKKTYGAGVAFGIEIVVPFFGTQLGFNVEIGQGFGRVISEHNKDKNIGSFILGSGIHIYF